MHTEFLKNRLRVGQYVHQVRNRRTLITGDVAHTALEQGLGDRQNALAPEHSAGLSPQLLHFGCK